MVPSVPCLRKARSNPAEPTSTWVLVKVDRNRITPARCSLSKIAKKRNWATPRGTVSSIQGHRKCRPVDLRRIARQSGSASGRSAAANLPVILKFFSEWSLRPRAELLPSQPSRNLLPRRLPLFSLPLLNRPPRREIPQGKLVNLWPSTDSTWSRPKSIVT